MRGIARQRLCPVSRKSKTDRRNIDLLQAVIVNLGGPDEPVNHKILRLMNVLLSSQTDVQEKQQVMQEEFHIAMTRELEREVSELCNLSQGIFNEGVSQGIRQGISQGRDEGIKGAVEILKDCGFEEQAIIEKIMDKYQLTPEAALEYILETGDG